MDQVVPTSTPGVPWNSYGPTNRHVLESARDVISRAVAQSFANMVFHGEKVFDMDAEQLVLNGIRDPVRVFIKNEPHKKSKADTGMWRLISGVSLVDQIKERIIGRFQNEAEIDSWVTCPSKPGIGLDDESLLEVAVCLRDMLSRGLVCSSDISGFDWSVKGWELRADAERRRQLAGASEASLFNFLLRVQAHCVANSVLVLPDGLMWAQLREGIQLSGSYWTSSTNSAMRLLMTLVARIRSGVAPDPIDQITMGDDSVERYWEGLDVALRELGHEVKFVKIYRSIADVEFCSHLWRDDGLAVPVNPWKTLFRYLSHPPDSTSYLDWRAQLMYFVRHSQELHRYRRQIDARAERANKVIDND